MNISNLQLEGLYMAVAAINNLLVTKGLMSRDEIAETLRVAEQTAAEDVREGLSPAQRDAIAFPLRLLQLANSSAGETGTIPFQELARMIGQQKDD